MIVFIKLTESETKTNVRPKKEHSARPAFAPGADARAAAARVARESYGKLAAFLFGWVEFLVVRSGSMATLAAAFGRYFAQMVPPPDLLRAELWQTGAATVAIALVTIVNVIGTRWGGTLQILGTVLKVGGVMVLIALPFVLGRGTIANWSPMWPSTVNGSIFTGMMTAMIGVLWAYDGWTNVTPLAEEIRDPCRNIPRSLIMGMAVLIAVYLGMTLAYHYVLPLPKVASAIRQAGHVETAVALRARRLEFPRNLGQFHVLRTFRIVVNVALVDADQHAVRRVGHGVVGLVV